MLPENYKIIELINKYDGILLSADGKNILPDGIRLILDEERIINRTLIMRKLIAYLKIASRTMNKE